MHSIANGYIYIPDENRHQHIKAVITSMYLDHGNVISSYATLAAYNESESWIDEVIEYMSVTIDWVDNFVSAELPEVNMYKPEGTYQIWLDFSGLNLSPQNLNTLIVDQAELALTPGAWFGGEHGQFMRMNIASPLAEIQKALVQLKAAVDQGVDTSCKANGAVNAPCCG